LTQNPCGSEENPVVRPPGGPKPLWYQHSGGLCKRKGGRARLAGAGSQSVLSRRRSSSRLSEGTMSGSRGSTGRALRISYISLKDGIGGT